MEANLQTVIETFMTMVQTMIAIMPSGHTVQNTEQSTGNTVKVPITITRSWDQPSTPPRHGSNTYYKNSGSYQRTSARDRRRYDDPVHLHSRGNGSTRQPRGSVITPTNSDNLELGKLLIQSCKLRHGGRNWRKIPTKIDKQFDRIFTSINPPQGSIEFRDEMTRVSESCKESMANTVRIHIQRQAQENLRKLGEHQQADFKEAATWAKNIVLKNYHGKIKEEEVDQWLEEDRGAMTSESRIMDIAPRTSGEGTTIATEVSELDKFITVTPSKRLSYKRDRPEEESTLETCNKFSLLSDIVEEEDQDTGLPPQPVSTRTPKKQRVRIDSPKPIISAIHNEIKETGRPQQIAKEPTSITKDVISSDVICEDIIDDDATDIENEEPHSELESNTSADPIPADSGDAVTEEEFDFPDDVIEEEDCNYHDLFEEDDPLYKINDLLNKLIDSRHFMRDDYRVGFDKIIQSGYDMDMTIEEELFFEKRWMESAVDFKNSAMPRRKPTKNYWKPAKNYWKPTRNYWN